MNDEPIADQITFDDFLAVDMRVGTILSAELNPKAIKPAYILQIDFGPTIGTRTSSAQITVNYTPEQLVGMQVIAVLNFPPRRIAGVKSEVLVLGAMDAERDVILLTPSLPAHNGSRIS
ncbi:MAG: tRNA-binding protein [Anaerolineae bacterium]